MLKSLRRLGDDDFRLFLRGVDAGLSTDFTGDASMSELPSDTVNELLLSVLLCEEILKSNPAMLSGFGEKTVA